MIKILKKRVRKPAKRKLPYRVNYHEGWLLPPAAIFVGTYMVLYTGTRSFGTAIFMADFYKAVVPSILAAWFAMWCIVQVTYLLDTRYPWAIAWHRGPLVRAALQLVFGMLMPAFFILGVFAVYFLVRGRIDLIIHYAVEDFPFVLLMLAGFNLVIWLYYRVRTREIMDKFRRWKREHGKSTEEMEARWADGGTPSEAFKDRMKDGVALFEPGQGSEEKGTWALMFTGERLIQLQSVEELERMLAGPDFCLIYRATLVNRTAIAEVHDTDGKARVVLLESLGSRVLDVSRRYRTAFLQWWEGT